MPIYTFEGQLPRIDPDAWVAPGARVIGDVEIGPGSSVWYNCVVRGDVMPICIGARSNIQDGSVIHVTTALHPTCIGDDVLVGHLAVIHGCTLNDRAFVGMGATVMDGCVIEEGGMLGAGALLTPGKTVRAGELWTGRPARFARNLTPEEMEGQARGAAHYVALAQRHRSSLGGASVAADTID